MDTTIEKLQSESNEIRVALESLQKQAQNTETEKKKQELVAQAEEAKKQAETLLQTETDENTKAQLEEIKKQLENYTSELQALRTEVKEQAQSTNQQETTASSNENSSAASPSSAPEKEKNFLQKGIDWIKGDEKETHHTAKAIGRGALVASWIGIGVYGLGKLFWRWGKKEEKADSSEGKEEKPKKTSRWKKALGWGAGILGGTWLGRGLLTGNWDFFGRNPFGKGKEADATSSSNTQALDTQELKEKEPNKFEKYKTLWSNIDTQYNQVMAKELQSWRWGMSIADGYKKYVNQKMSFEDYQATVPMCIDNEFSSVSSLLSESSHYLYLKEKQFTEIKAEIFQWWEDKIKNILGPFLSSLTSFIPFKGKSRSEALKLWSESGNPSDREAELQLFFRQYAKIVNYAQDKLIKLKHKIAEEKFPNVGGEFSSVEDALEDGERVAQYIENDPRFKNFTQGKLHQAIDIMQENKIFDANLSSIMEKYVTTADAERDRLLQTRDGKDLLKRLEEANGPLSLELNREAIEACKDIKEDIEENFDKSWTYLYFSGAHSLINSDDKNIQEFLEHSGLKALKSAAMENLSFFQKKFEGWSMTAEDLQLYKNQVNSYFAMKKEILIGAEAIQQLKSDNTSRWARALDIGAAVWSDFLTHTKEAYKKCTKWSVGGVFEGWLWATAPLVVGGAVIKFAGKKSEIKWVEKIWRWIQKSNIFSVAWWLKGQAMRRIPSKNLNFMPNRMLSSRYHIEHGDQLLFQDIIEGKISWYKVKKILDKGSSLWKTADKKTKSLSEFIQKMAGKSDTELPAKYLGVLFENKAGIPFTRNKSLRKLFFRQEKIGALDQTKVLRNGYRRKMYVPDGIHHVEMLETFMNGEAGKTSKFAQLSQKQQKMFVTLVWEGNFSKIEDLTHLMENIDKLPLDGVPSWKFFRLSQELSQNLDLFTDEAKLSKFTEDSINKPLSSTVDDAIENMDEALHSADEITESILESNSYKALDLEFENRLKILNNDLAWASDVKKLQIQKQIDHLENIKKNFAINKTQVEIDQLFNFYKEYNKLVPNKSIANLDTLGKMLSKNLPDLEKALKELDLTKLKQLKSAGHFDDVGDEAFESVVKMIDELKVKKMYGVKVFKNSDEMLDGIKAFVKILTKST